MKQKQPLRSSGAARALVSEELLVRRELARAHACDLGSDLQKRGVPSVRLGKCEQRKRSAGCLTSRDGIKDGDFPVDCAR